MLAQYVVTEGAVLKGEAEWTSRVDTNQGTVEGCAAPNTHIGQGHVAGEPAGSMARLGLRHADIRSMPLVPGIHHHMHFLRKQLSALGNWCVTRGTGDD